MERAAGTIGFIGFLIIFNLASWYFHWGFWLY